MTTAPIELAAGQTIAGRRGRYTIERPLGTGGFGHAFVARTDGDEVVVLKQLRVDRMQDWKALELFGREARVLAGLSHPNIPRHVELFAHDGAQAHDPASLGDGTNGALALFSVAAFVPGRSLEEHVVWGSAFTAPALTAILERLLHVLDYLHGLQPPVVHRDIKPANVVLDETGSPHLVDFGAIKDHLRDGSTSVGTFGYFPMEQMMGQAQAASDLYALGMTILVVATRVRPENMPTDPDTGKVDLGKVAPGLPPAVRGVLDGLLEPAIGRRTKTAAEALARLRDPTRALAVRPSADVVPARSPAIARLANVCIGLGGVAAAAIYFVFFDSMSETTLVRVSALWAGPLAFGFVLHVVSGTQTKHPVSRAVAITGVLLLGLIFFFEAIFPSL